MGIEPIIIKSHSSQEQVDKAYRIMCDKYRDLIIEYCSDKKISLVDLVNEAQCHNPDRIKKFVLSRGNIITGKDLDRLLCYTNLSQRFAEEVPVIIGSEIIYPEAICGTSVDEIGETAHREATEMPEAFDRLAKKIISRTMWFYVQATERFLSDRE